MNVKAKRKMETASDEIISWHSRVKLPGAMTMLFPTVIESWRNNQEN